MEIESEFAAVLTSEQGRADQRFLWIPIVWNANNQLICGGQKKPKNSGFNAEQEFRPGKHSASPFYNCGFVWGSNLTPLRQTIPIIKTSFQPWFTIFLHCLGLQVIHLHFFCDTTTLGYKLCTISAMKSTLSTQMEALCHHEE